jgi:hypothetical protein
VSTIIAARVIAEWKVLGEEAASADSNATAAAAAVTLSVISDCMLAMITDSSPFMLTSLWTQEIFFSRTAPCFLLVAGWRLSFGTNLGGPNPKAVGPCILKTICSAFSRQFASRQK